MKNRLLSLLLSALMILSLMPAVFAAEYNDVDGHWAEDAIDRWSDYGIVQGYDGGFNPDGSLTRGQLAAVIARLLNLPEAEDAGFADADGHWAEDVINSCAAAGIMKGDGVNARPDDTITREETIVMLARALGIKPVEDVDLSEFTDHEKVADWAEGYVAAMNEAGLIKGIDGGIAPDTDINRASAVTLLNRAITTYANEPGATVEATGSGIVLVVAEDVTVTGEADSVLIAQGAAGGTTNLDGVTAGSITVQAADSVVIIGEGTEIGDLDVSIQASDVTVKVDEAAKVENVTTEATGTTVEGDGKVENVQVGENAADTTVNTEGSKVENNSADNVTVGTGTVESGSAGTSNGEDKAPTPEVPVIPDTPDTPSEPGTGVKPEEHTHVTVGYISLGNGTHNKVCVCGETYGADSGCRYGSDEVCDLCGYDSHVHNYSYVSLDNGKHNKVCTCGLTSSENCDGDSCTKCGYITGAVAKIGTAYFVTLKDAVDAATNGSTITIVANIDLGGTTLYIPAGKIVTFDLNGKVISGVCNANQASMIYIENTAKLTVKDTSANESGKITYASGTSKTGFEIDVKGDFVLESGTIELTGGWNLGFAVDVRPNAWGTAYTAPTTFIMNGGKIDSSDTGVRIDSNSSNSYEPLGVTFTMNAGVIESEWDAIFVQHRYANDLYVNVVNGTVSGTNSVLRIYGSPIVSDVYFTIENGSFTGVIKDLDKVGGGYTAIKGGTFTADPSAYVVDGYKATESDGKWTVAVLGESNSEAKIGTTYYATLGEAIDKAIDTNGTVVLLTDVTLTETFTIPKNIELTLDLNGYDIIGTSTSAVNTELFVVSGTLNVIGDGTISLTNDAFEWNTSARYTTINIRETGVVTLGEGVEVICDAGSKTETGYGMSYAVDIYTTGTLTVNGASLHSNYIAVRCFFGASVVNVNSGSSITSSRNNYGIWKQSADGAVITIADGVEYTINESNGIYIFG